MGALDDRERQDWTGIKPVEWWGGGENPAEVGCRKVLHHLGDQIQATKILNGWTITTPELWDDQNQVPADLALLHSEVSEALEAFRRNDLPGFAGELADVAIRLIGLARLAAAGSVARGEL